MISPLSEAKTLGWSSELCCVLGVYSATEACFVELGSAQGDEEGMVHMPLSQVEMAPGDSLGLGLTIADQSMELSEEQILQAVGRDSPYIVRIPKLHNVSLLVCRSAQDFVRAGYFRLDHGGDGGRGQSHVTQTSWCCRLDGVRARFRMGQREHARDRKCEWISKCGAELAS